MANLSIDCTACTELQENATIFLAKGVTDAVCANLKNNKGVSGTSNNFDELNDVVDCLIGNMVAEIEAYDVCDWKDYMRKLVPNLYNTLKAILCDITGLRDDLEDLEDIVDGLCTLVEGLISAPTKAYGTLVGSSYTSSDKTSRQCGTICTLYGDDTLIATRASSDEVPTNEYAHANIGISFGTKTYTNCDGKTQTDMWLGPDIRGYKFHVSSDKVYDGGGYDTHAQYAVCLWYMSSAEMDKYLGKTFADYIRTNLKSGYSANNYSGYWMRGKRDRAMEVVRLAYNSERSRLEIQHNGFIPGDYSFSADQAIFSNAPDHTTQFQNVA